MQPVEDNESATPVEARAGTPYEAPRLEVYGSVSTLTQSLRQNVFSDGTFGSSSLSGG